MCILLQEMCHELYNGEFVGAQDWLDGLLKDDSGCLLGDCMLMSGISLSLNLQCSPVNSEHSYSLAADCSRSASLVKTELDDCMYYWLSLKLYNLGVLIMLLHCCSLFILLYLFIYDERQHAVY